MKKITYNNKYFILILAMFSALPPFAIDTYLPAAPQIAGFFNVKISEIIVTVTTYFVGFALGMFLWGLLSDRFGRKKILIIGMILYVLSTIICSITDSFFTFKIMRAVQGLSDASGAIVAMSMARDCFSGKKLKAVISSMIIVMMAAPIVAPIIGSVLIVLTSEWQSIFHFLTIYGLILLGLSFFLEETLSKNKMSKNLKHSLSFYTMHLRNYKFLIMSISSGLCFAAIFSFIGSSSVIFLGAFSTGYVVYCILFSVNILGIIFANILIKSILLNAENRIVMVLGFTSCFVGILICILSYHLYPVSYVFAIGIMMVTFGFALSSTILQADALNNVSVGFGAANSIGSVIKFTLAGISNLYMSFYSEHNIVAHLSYQQVFIAVLAVSFFYFSQKFSSSEIDQ